MTGLDQTARRGQPEPPAAGRSLEGAVQIAIMLVIGVAAGAASFSHVHDVAASHGQRGWLAWADAVVLELMSIASGLELRRRHRVGASPVFPAGVMAAAVLLSISAQLVEAQPSPIGWIAAALPALGFLVMVKIAMGRSQDPIATDTREGVEPRTPKPPEATPAVDKDAVAGPRQRPAPDGRAYVRRHAEPVTRPPRRDTPLDPVTTALLPAARTAAETLRADGRRLSRNALADVLRREGYAASNARVSSLLLLLKAEGDQVMPVRTSATRR